MYHGTYKVNSNYLSKYSIFLTIFLNSRILDDTILTIRLIGEHIWKITQIKRLSY